MEEKTEGHLRWGALLTAAAILVLGAVLLWPVGRMQEDGTPTAGCAAIETARSTQEAVSAGNIGPLVVPVGRTVGIKLFSDGVLVVGLFALDREIWRLDKD